MNTTLTILFTLSAIAAFGGLGLLSYGLWRVVKRKEEFIFIHKGGFLFITIGAAVFTLMLMLSGIVLSSPIENHLHRFMAVFGTLLFGLFVSVGVSSFFLHYYKFNVEKKFNKYGNYVAFISFGLAILALFLLIDGYAYGGMIKFPLPTGIPFNKPVIAFYALFILAGALLVLAICDHEFYKKYGRHGILEPIFYLAFPAGIVGARIWYVAGNWTRNGYNEDFLQVFRIWEGGLAIMGGALFGALAGILYFRFKYKKMYSIAEAIDLIIPAILVAQAVGRWGNFFNQEVYGAVSDINKYSFLPYFIRRQMVIYDEFRVPLFLIESFVNLTGYFVIRFAVGEGLKKWREPLDMGFLYLFWYGLTRVIMEPMRDPIDNMGDKGQWSFIWAIIFVAVSVVAIVANHIIRYQLRKRKPALASGEVIETEVVSEEKKTTIEVEVKEKGENENGK